MDSAFYIMNYLIFNISLAPVYKVNIDRLNVYNYFETLNMYLKIIEVWEQNSWGLNGLELIWRNTFYRTKDNFILEISRSFQVNWNLRLPSLGFAASFNDSRKNQKTLWHNVE